jgi:hypothetical protein
MNKKIIRASWDNSIEYYDARKVERTNNLIVGGGIAVMIVVCLVMYGVMSVIS